MKRMNICVFFGIFFSLFFLSFFAIPLEENTLVKISNEYKSFELFNQSNSEVANQRYYNWTISLCVHIPVDSLEKKINQTLINHNDTLFISNAKQKSPHGNKLYKFYVKDLKSYIKNGNTQPIGQVLVKETWNVKEIDKMDSNFKVKVQSLNNGKWYTPVTVSQLFIMYKEAENDYNDKGWVYGIVDIENQQRSVLSSGKISNCIQCHQNTKYDRIFGIKR